MRAKYVIALILLTIACRERVNPYDPGSDSFSAPPPVYAAWPILGWYNTSGQLVGLRVQVDFVESFSSSFEITNALYRGIEELARDSIPVGAGMDSYVVDLISDGVLDYGDYLVLFFWDEFSIGNELFWIIDFEGNKIIYGVSEYDTLPAGY
jgi:hypothetical protein